VSTRGRKKKGKREVKDEKFISDLKAEVDENDGMLHMANLWSYLKECEENGLYPSIFSSRNYSGIFMRFYTDALCDYLKITCQFKDAISYEEVNKVLEKSKFTYDNLLYHAIPL